MIYLQSLAGLWVALWIFAGLIGAVIVSILADRTKYFEEIFKLLNAFMVLALIWFVLVSCTVHSRLVDKIIQRF